MGDTEKCSNTEMIHRLHSSFNTTSSSSQIPKVPQLNPNFISPSTQFSSQPFGESGVKRIGVPPTSPYSQIQQRPLSSSSSSQSFVNHSRSMSQPNSFFSFDSLPPLSPSPFREDTNRCNSRAVVVSESLPPRKSHRRSNSDIPNGFSSVIPSRVLERSVSGGECVDWSKANPFVKKECEREGGEAMDDLFSAYMNLDNIDVLNSSEADDSKNGNESSRASGTKTNGSDTEGETSSVNESANNVSEKRESVKRRAGDGDIAPTGRHYRSVSVDSCFMEKLSFGDESSLHKPPPSPGTLSRKVSPTNSVDGNSSAAAGFSIEFKNGEFTAAEMKKIMANDKLAEMAMADPKRVKRILANRQSAARSKERKMRYIVELEHKVQTLQTEATTLSAQLTLLQRDMIGFTNQNNELKFRLQAMEQQARLRDALNEALNGEVQRLKQAIGESSHNESDRSKMQSLNAEMFQQLNISQLQQQNQNGTMGTTKPESNE